MKEVGHILKASIEAWAAGMRENSRLGHATRNGELTPRALALYLESLRYLFEHSQRNLKVAAECASQRGLTSVAEYFQHKADEERGHDRWALSDLAKLPAAVTRDLQPAREIQRLVELQGSLIARHPMCFVAYALWAEYFTVLVGDEWLEALAKYGYDRSQLSAISKHLEADREHAAHGFEQIDRLWGGDPSPAVLMDAVARAQQIFESFCDEICQEARRAA